MNWTYCSDELPTTDNAYCLFCVLSRDGTHEVVPGQWDATGRCFWDADWNVNSHPGTSAGDAYAWMYEPEPAPVR